MADSNPVVLTFEQPLQLANKVVIGTVDVAAVGARTLLSLAPPVPEWTVRETALQLPGLPSFAGGSISAPEEEVSRKAALPVLAVANDAAHSASTSASPAAPLSAVVRNFYPPDAADAAVPGASLPQISLVILNTLVPEGEQAEVAAALMDLLTSSGGHAAAAAGRADRREDGGPQAPANTAAGATAVPAAGGAGAAAGGAEARCIVVVAALLLQQTAQPAALYQHLVNGAPPLNPELPPLQLGSPSVSADARGVGASAGSPAAAVRVRDGQLAALLHVLDVSGTPATCLLAPGHKPPASTSLDLADSVPACDAIGAALAVAFGLQYDAAKCRAVRALYKWFVPEKSAGSDVMYL